MTTTAPHYDASYFEWQREIGTFGGWANLPKFRDYVRPEDVVLDFGCGGGFLLRNLTCGRRVGVEVNAHARAVAASNGVEVHENLVPVASESVDVVISNHCLEHVPEPLRALRDIRSKLKPGGLAVFVVPCEAISMAYEPDNIDRHLYTWSPMCLGNLFADAGFEVIESTPYMHKWPPFYRQIARVGGRVGFDLASRIWARVERSIFQVRIVARRGD